MTIIFGLGNPGLAYKNTRHNVGYGIVEELAKNNSLRFKSSKFMASVAEGSIQGKKVLLVRPETYMNLSGVCVLNILKYYNASPEDIIIAYDDIDLPLGNMRIRQKGSAGSHNGMRSIVDMIKCEEFVRVRGGIGKPQGDLKKFVLGRFKGEDREIARRMFERGAEAIEEVLKNGVSAAQAKFNGGEKQ